MSQANMKEINLEQDIEQWLCTKGGYQKGDPKAYDKALALDTATLFSFIKTTQPKEWAKQERNNPGRAEKSFLDEFNSNVKHNGLLHVLRKGFKDKGVHFRVVFWKPESDLNPDAVARYQANILHCTRQLHYSLANENSVDIQLFVNGIPIVCLELKNQLTGQTVANAMQQFKNDRSPNDALFAFKNRTLVCFAVDLTTVMMTTQLQGKNTVFLPFNQGSNGPGVVGGAGNPVPEDGYAVSYLWENVLEKDNLLELLHNYLHLQTKETKDADGNIQTSQRLIFPRYHQWDVVRKLLADVKVNGAGRNYLIQHSAGSGKRNSISWLAHRLAGLHDDQNNKIFQGVVIVTDRRVLDSQLQKTVSQFDHVDGLVVKIDKNSKQLRDAMNSGAGIIITTIQKFPVIFEEVEHHKKNYAIIVDEAHSSQTGQAATKLKEALADTEEVLQRYADEENADENRRDEMEDSILHELASHGQHKNLSFFAFTATPKDKTLQIFGQPVPDTKKYVPFHIYSMLQAIEEGFILDVLQNYMTYQTYYKLLKKTSDDPQFKEFKGKRAAIRYQTLHPYNIAQKTSVMLEHFREVTATKIGGRAKAMVVTASRLHAVRYVKEFAKQIEANGYNDVKILVAFSGEVAERNHVYAECGLNEEINGIKIQESQLPSHFANEFNILIVAEKYQTGFDEPLLHTMFVDKKLTSVKAVQTLSRLNRTAPGKQDTFVLDFVNKWDEIQKSFAPYYESTTLLEGTNPNIIYTIRTKLEKQGIFNDSDLQKFRDALSKQGKADSALAAASKSLLPVVEVYKAKNEEEQNGFKTGLHRFNRLYNFVTQICRMFDEDMYYFSLFAKSLSRLLPRDESGPVNLDSQIDLEYYKLKNTYKGKIPLKPSEGLGGIKGESGGASKEDLIKLSSIVEEINNTFGTNFDPSDKVMPLQQIRESISKDPKFVSLSKDGDEQTLRMVYEREFPEKVVSVFESNKELFDLLLNNTNMLAMVKDRMWEFIQNDFKENQKMAEVS